MERTKTVAYVRVSTAGQADEGVSLAAQESKARAYAELYDLELVGIVEDAGASAKSLVRPGLSRVLGMLKDGEADAVLVTKLDRLTRSTRDLGTLLDMGFRDKWGLFSVAEQVDTRTAAGRLVLNVLMSVAEWEREAIGERTKEALSHLKAEGVQLGGAALGWERGEEEDEEGRRVVKRIKREVEVVERILELRGEGLSLRAIARTLQSEGRKTKRGGRWASETVRKVLLRAQAA